ncbi:MAG: hypothetical protein ABIR59_12070 [Gemmatimonadales bacterium]
MARSLLLTLAPWAGAVVLAGVVGTVIGASGLVGHPERHETVVSVSSAVVHRADAASCPGGPVVATLLAGTRVLAISRSADSAQLGVRDPSDSGRELWLAAADLTLDPSQPAIATLAVEACPVIGVSVAAPPAPAPAPPASVAAPGVSDTVKPTITSAIANPTQIYQHLSSHIEKSTVSAIATDNVAVTAISASWPTVGPIPAGTAQISGGSGSFVFGPYSFSEGGDNDVPITLIAHDAAGNASTPTVVHVIVTQISG